MQLDVTAFQETPNQKASDAIAINRKVDVLVNNTAYTQFSTLEDMKLGDHVSQFTTNSFKTINITRAFLPHLRKRREGVIVHIGSMAAWESYPAVGAYSASKAATDATEALDHGTNDLGIKTLLVESCQCRTELLSAESRVFAEPKFPEYQELTGANGKQRSDPKKQLHVSLMWSRGERGQKRDSGQRSWRWARMRWQPFGRSDKIR
ncbi:uncharacterized protein AFUA_3G02950 [Aspergillus fumigatus Af293]